MGNPKTITIETDNGPVVVRKMALGEYAEFLLAMKKAPTQFAKIIENNEKDDFKDMTKLVSICIDFAADSFQDFVALIAIPTDKDTEFFEKQVGLSEAIQVIVAVLELNDYSKVMDSVKKLTARNKPGDQPKTEPEKLPKDAPVMPKE